MSGENCTALFLLPLALGVFSNRITVILNSFLKVKEAMDVWSVGGDTEHIAREESPSMKDIVNKLRYTNPESNITCVDEDREEEAEGEDVDLVSKLAKNQ